MTVWAVLPGVVVLNSRGPLPIENIHWIITFLQLTLACLSSQTNICGGKTTSLSPRTGSRLMTLLIKFELKCILWWVLDQFLADVIVLSVEQCEGLDGHLNCKLVCLLNAIMRFTTELVSWLWGKIPVVWHISFLLDKKQTVVTIWSFYSGRI